jgi:PhzF family phenazine biosynthesis protein
MKIPIYQVDAFTSKVFAGNPAAVCLLDAWPDDGLLQAIGGENNLSETAFLVRHGDGFELRWFTPRVEVALCGHATLASAFVLFTCRDWPGTEIRFESRHSGRLVVTLRDDMLEMDFPARPPESRSSFAGLERALGVKPQAILASAEDALVVLPTEAAVREVRPDFVALREVDCRGTIVTAPGERCDFVSRFFAPRVGVPEDPVTGSAHCVLIPYWAQRLGRTQLRAQQVSARGGEIFCEDRGPRVGIAGHAALYLTGEIVL